MQNLKIFITVTFFFLIQFLGAQNIEKNYCGTKPSKSEWLKNYQKNPAAFKTRFEETLYVPLTIHILGSDTGSGYFSVIRLHKALCTLNKDFEDANISFYIKGEIDYIDDSNLYKHDSIRTGGLMMLENNIAETINCYIVNDPAGNCGYSLPYGGVAMGINCMGANDHTWAHEIGHFCSLPHPFLGWEGGVSWDNSIKHNFNDPAPEIVLYNYTDFKSEFFENDTLIIDTAFVEKVDGSNCQIAADGFCDTKPDYLNYRWECDENLESTRSQKDPNGVEFYSDATLIMSYARDNCSYRFTPEQIGALRANIIDTKGFYSLGTDIKIISETSTPIQPINEENVPYKNIYFEWEPVENADYYVLYVSKYSSFSNLAEKITTTEPFVTVDQLKKDKKHYWKVYAYNNYNFCNDFSEVAEFKTSLETATNEISYFENISISPQLLDNQQDLNISLISKQSIDIEIEILNTAGVQVQKHNRKISLGSNRWEIKTGSLVSGLYFLKVKTDLGSLTKKFIMQ